jgi:hypothetical protein
MNRPLRLLPAIGVLLLLCGAAAARAQTTQPEVGFDTAREMPRDATALCEDGSWSSSTNRSGTCSGHGGIRKWFGKPPKRATFRCKDGTYSKAKDSQGACSQHGGIAFALAGGKPKE